MRKRFIVIAACWGLAARPIDIPFEERESANLVSVNGTRVILNMSIGQGDVWSRRCSFADVGDRGLNGREVVPFFESN